MKTPGLPLPPGYRVEANSSFAYLYGPSGAIVIAAQDDWTRKFLLQFEHEYKTFWFDEIDDDAAKDHNT